MIKVSLVIFKWFIVSNWQSIKVLLQHSSSSAVAFFTCVFLLPLFLKDFLSSGTETSICLINDLRLWRSVTLPVRHRATHESPRVASQVSVSCSCRFYRWQFIIIIINNAVMCSNMAETTCDWWRRRGEFGVEGFSTTDSSSAGAFKYSWETWCYVQVISLRFLTLFVVKTNQSEGFMCGLHTQSELLQCRHQSPS